MNLPVSLEANWIFRMTEKPRIKAYFAGLRKAIFFLKIGPLFVLIFTVYTVLWDSRAAFFHSLYGLMISILVMEVLFTRFVKIPFACSYLPGKERIHVFWFLYLVGFIGYVKIMGGIELELLKSPSKLIIVFAVVLLSIIGIRIYQINILYKRDKIHYEEEPEPIMVGLDFKRPSHLKEG